MLWYFVLNFFNFSIVVSFLKFNFLLSISFTSVTSLLYTPFLTASITTTLLSFLRSIRIFLYCLDQFLTHQYLIFVCLILNQLIQPSWQVLVCQYLLLFLYLILLYNQTTQLLFYVQYGCLFNKNSFYKIYFFINTTIK